MDGQDSVWRCVGSDQMQDHSVRCAWSTWIDRASDPARGGGFFHSRSEDPEQPSPGPKGRRPGLNQVPSSQGRGAVLGGEHYYTGPCHSQQRPAIRDLVSGFGSIWWRQARSQTTKQSLSEVLIHHYSASKRLTLGYADGLVFSFGTYIAGVDDCGLKQRNTPSSPALCGAFSAENSAYFSERKALDATDFQDIQKIWPKSPDTTISTITSALVQSRISHLKFKKPNPETRLNLKLVQLSMKFQGKDFSQ